MLIIWISLIILILAVLARKARPIWQQWRELGADKRAWQLLKLSYRLDKIFDTAQTYQAAQQDRSNLSPNLAFTYGEIPFVTLENVLRIAKAKAGENFYDLGAGDGRAVISALLLVPFAKVCGIEMLPTLHQYSQHYRQKWSLQQQLPAHFSADKVHFMQADYFEFDFSDADIIYINATGLFGEDWENLLHKFQQLKPHTRIITTSRQIDCPHFKLLNEAWRAMSWGLNRVYIYEKTQ